MSECEAFLFCILLLKTYIGRDFLPLALYLSIKILYQFFERRLVDGWNNCCLHVEQQMRVSSLFFSLLRLSPWR
jgi:hypothetical protein